jgi:hypothetical protein
MTDAALFSGLKPHNLCAICENFSFVLKVAALFSGLKRDTVFHHCSLASVLAAAALVSGLKLLEMPGSHTAFVQ